MIRLLIDLFVVFFKIGLFGFGGGYGMISMIQFDVVDQYKWMNVSEFADVLALSQMTPGPISINCATYVGYQQGMALGGTSSAIICAIWATLSLCLPTIILMALVVRYLFKNRENPYVKSVMKWIKPVVVGMIASAAMLMMNEENFSTGSDLYVTVAICAVSFVATYFGGINPIYLIILSGLIGALVF